MTTLYKPAKTGATQQWSIKVQGDSFICTYGQLDGKMQTQTTKCEPKNIGRANETTPEQQAVLEMDALIAKKIKSGYSYDSTAPTTVALAMKVKSYQDQINNIKFPCFSTPKLNGVNAIYRRVDGQLTIYSRGGEIYPAIPHLEPFIHEIMELSGFTELNGELYIHGEHLQDIQSTVKKPNELSPKLTFAIFDICDSKDIYLIRNKLIHNAFLAFYKTQREKLETIAFLTGVVCDSHADIENHYLACVRSGFEGTVIKNYDALYQHNVRSSDMFKYKKVLSAEFLISNYNLDKNGLPVFVMKCTAGEFKAKPIGTKEFWAKVNPNDYLGNYATIEYETLSKDGLPLKPIFISLRSMDTDGNPKE